MTWAAVIEVAEVVLDGLVPGDGCCDVIRLGMSGRDASSLPIAARAGKRRSVVTEPLDPYRTLRSR
jgi:hypothetical protein